MTDNQLTDAFTAVHGGVADGIWAAPGRVNLIGEHTDYNDGFVLPIALPHAARAAVRRREDDLLRLHSAQADGAVVELTAEELRPGTVPGWARYAAGVVWALRDAGHPVGGADIHLDSDVPTGAGLSSSAALECVVAVAYNDLWDLGLGPVELGLLAQRAENVFVGVPCGAMDQLASTCCEAGRALFLDTRTLTARQLPVDLAAAGLRLLVIDTQVKHDLADGAYAERRSGCEKAAGLLGLAALRDLDPAGLPAALETLPDEGLRSLTRHVVTENARVEAAVEALLAGEPAALGPILTAGHASLRDDFLVSCAETDLVVATANAAGALGARMTGGGFGGSVIALVADADADRVAGAVTAAFAAAGYTAPRVFTALAAQGARRLA
ncbi:galactokinase [Kitasatospora sp. NBC_00240]|uniref:galactokinase n=1 Tax=Kitasatospora sp. NBC_00240 TaxID=2903567 RepID=UPI002254B7FA|nr:galactokinase [Kitasatospora sp. NBC_00240]MCX5208683.1 galactokinase [Kitasatospora sp. NBC_00240]